MPRRKVRGPEEAEYEQLGISCERYSESKSVLE